MASPLPLGGRPARRSLVARAWAMFSGAPGGAEEGTRRHLPTLFDLLDWLEVLELAERPFDVETLRRRLEYVMGVRITFVTARGALQGRVANPGAVYQILRSEMVSRGGVNGGMIRDPATEDAVVMTPGDLRTEEELKPPLHELMHVALGDPAPVAAGAPFPEEAVHKLRRETRSDGAERLYWCPDARAFPAPPLFDHEACEQRAELLAEYALLASVYGGETLRELDDDFWR